MEMRTLASALSAGRGRPYDSIGLRPWASADTGMAAPVEPSRTGSVTLDLSSAPLGGHINNYIDTLHSDYAFIITPGPFVKSDDGPVEADATTAQDVWDIALYPNPTVDMVHVESRGALMEEISILDLTGRVITTRSQLNAPRVQFDVNRLAKGAYWIRASCGGESRTRKLILNRP